MLQGISQAPSREINGGARDLGCGDTDVREVLGVFFIFLPENSLLKSVFPAYRNSWKRRAFPSASHSKYWISAKFPAWLAFLSQSNQPPTPPKKTKISIFKTSSHSATFFGPDPCQPRPLPDSTEIVTYLHPSETSTVRCTCLAQAHRSLDPIPYPGQQGAVRNSPGAPR